MDPRGGVPQIDFSPIGDLGDTYNKAQDRATLQNLGALLSDPNADYRQAAGLAAKAGRFDIALPLIQRANQRDAITQSNAAIDEFGAPKPPQGTVPLSAIGAPPVQPPARQPMAMGPSGQPALAADGGLQPPDMAPSAASLDPQHRDMLIRTVFGEARNQSPEGQAAVASVVKNRMASGKYGGADVPSVVLAKNQFEPWNNPEARAGILGLSPDDPRYKRIGQMVDMVFGGQIADPTNGATHFFAPKAQAALGRDVPAWAQGAGQPIGDHTFYAPDGRVAQASPPRGAMPPTPESASPPAASPSRSAVAAQAPQQPAPAAPRDPADAFSAQAVRIGKILSNPDLPDGARQYWLKVLEKITPEDNKLMQLPDGSIVAANARTNTVTPIYQGAKPSFQVIGKDQNGNDVHGFVDVTSGKVRDINNNPINTGALAGVGAQPSPDLTGDAFLKTLDPGRANQIKAIADGRMNPPGGMSLKSPAIQGLMRDVAQYEPGFDLTSWTARNKTRADLASGKMGQNVTAFNTAIGHLETLDKAAEALDNSWSPKFNSIANWITEQRGDPRIKNFEVARTAVADELTRAFRGSGGNVHDLVQWENAINSAGSPAQLKAAIKQAVDLLRSRIDSVGDQYSRGMSKTTDPLTLLSPKAAAGIRRLSGEVDPTEAAPLPQPNAGAPPVPGARQAADGKWYVDDPARPGKFLMVQP